MKKFLFLFLGVSTLAFAAGKLQDADFKTELDLIAAGGNASLLLNDTKIYITSVAKTLDDAIADGDIGGGVDLTAKGNLIGFGTATEECVLDKTDGKLLTVDSAATCGFDFKDAPVSTTLSAKGEIQGHNGTTNVAIPAPTSDGVFLVSDSSQDSGWKESDQLQGVLNPLSDWEDFTLTPTNGITFGNGTVENAKYRQVGDSAEVRFTFTLGSTSSVSGDIRFEIPTGLSKDTSKIVAGTKVPLGRCSMLNSGLEIISATVVNSGVINEVIIRSQADNGSTTGVTRENSMGSTYPFTWATNDSISCYYSFPVLGWTSGTNAVVRNKVLRKVRARKTTSQTFLDGVHASVIFDDELEDNANLYNNVTGVFTCPEAGSKFRVGYNVYFRDLDTNSDSIQVLSITNGTDIYEVFRNQGIGNAGDLNPNTQPFDFECASNGEQWNFRALCAENDNTNCTTRASSGTTYFNSLSVTELADSSVIAGTFGKCQRKFLSANVTSDTTNVSDLRFNNLTVGQRYTIKLQSRVINFSSGSDTVYANVYNSGSFLFGGIHSNPLNQEDKREFNYRFTATGTQVTFDLLSIASGEYFYGNGGGAGTFAELCTDNREETTEWN